MIHKTARRALRMESLESRELLTVNPLGYDGPLAVQTNQSFAAESTIETEAAVVQAEAEATSNKAVTNSIASATGITSNSATISWTKPTIFKETNGNIALKGAGNYTLTIHSDSQTSYTIDAATLKTKTSWTETGLFGGTKYDYTITATLTAKNAADQSKLGSEQHIIAQGIIETVPFGKAVDDRVAPPTDIKTSITSGIPTHAKVGNAKVDCLKVTWKAPPNYTGAYQVDFRQWDDTTNTAVAMTSTSGFGRLLNIAAGAKTEAFLALSNITHQDGTKVDLTKTRIKITVRAVGDSYTDSIPNSTFHGGVDPVPPGVTDLLKPRIASLDARACSGVGVRDGLVLISLKNLTPGKDYFVELLDEAGNSLNPPLIYAASSDHTEITCGLLGYGRYTAKLIGDDAVTTVSQEVFVGEYPLLDVISSQGGPSGLSNEGWLAYQFTNVKPGTYYQLVGPDGLVATPRVPVPTAVGGVTTIRIDHLFPGKYSIELWDSATGGKRLTPTPPITITPDTVEGTSSGSLRPHSAMTVAQNVMTEAAPTIDSSVAPPIKSPQPIYVYPTCATVFWHDTFGPFDAIDGFLVYIRDSNKAVIDSGFVPFDTSNYTTGVALVPKQAYTVEVYTVTSDYKISEKSLKLSFKTPDILPYTAKVNKNDIKQTEAALSFAGPKTPNPAAFSYVYKVQYTSVVDVKGKPDWDAAFSEEVSDPDLTQINKYKLAEPLQPGTQYFVRLITVGTGKAATLGSDAVTQGDIVVSYGKEIKFKTLDVPRATISKSGFAMDGHDFGFKFSVMTPNTAAAKTPLLDGDNSFTYELLVADGSAKVDKTTGMLAGAILLGDLGIADSVIPSDKTKYEASLSPIVTFATLEEQLLTMGQTLAGMKTLQFQLKVTYTNHATAVSDYAVNYTKPAKLTMPKWFV